MLEMKKCKECGKLFVPKSPRSQYCDAIHYRPCPVCGKPVEAKYLSDPARCCSKECQQAMRKSKESKPAMPSSKPVTSDYVFAVEVPKAEESSERPVFEVPHGSAHVIYIGKKLLHFEPGHEYIVKVSKEENMPYLIEAVYDVTEGYEVNLAIYLASKTSIANYFVRKQVS